MLCLGRRKQRPSSIQCSLNRFFKQCPCGSWKNRKRKKQVSSPPGKRITTLLEVAMQVISDMMFEGNLWAPEEEVLKEVLEKQTMDDVTEEEVMKALECGISFGVVLRSTAGYSLPRKIQFMIEEGGVPDWTEYCEDWPSKPKKVRKKKERKRKKSHRRRKRNSEIQV